MYPFMRWSLRRQCIPRWRFPILFESRFLVVFVPVFGLILDVPALIESAVALYCCISMAARVSTAFAWREWRISDVVRWGAR